MKVRPEGQWEIEKHENSKKHENLKNHRYAQRFLRVGHGTKTYLVYFNAFRKQALGTCIYISVPNPLGRVKMMPTGPCFGQVWDAYGRHISDRGALGRAR